MNSQFNVIHLVLIAVIVILVIFMFNRCTLSCSGSENLKPVTKEEAEDWNYFCTSIRAPYPPQHGKVSERNQDRLKCRQAGFPTTPIEGPIEFQRLPWEKIP